MAPGCAGSNIGWSTPAHSESLALRRNWGRRHWQCQRALPVAHGLLPKSYRVPPLIMNVFLTCRAWYVESSKILFELVTPVFTSSADAYRFFAQQPRRNLRHLRHLELSITQKDDRVCLTRWMLARSSGPALPGVPYGDRLWRKLIEKIEERALALRHLDINIGCGIYATTILRPFGDMVGVFNQETGGEGLVPESSERHTELRKLIRRMYHEPWVLPDKLVVQFWPRDNSKAVVYVQEGKNMVKRA
ncbi:hypothetical protein B0I37DRAFT_352105 [Chaetomium sp. MPI-CAGE-AT-0009]|nr:hypothetical protein B0I37DRAFT_352105 [Chaetomium sp. MPI-CAGE-AT-0009]